MLLKDLLPSLSRRGVIDLRIGLKTIYEGQKRFIETEIDLLPYHEYSVIDLYATGDTLVILIWGCRS